MGDLLLSLSGNSVSRSMLGMVGLPTPQALHREEGPTSENPLREFDIQVAGGPWAHCGGLAA